MLGHPSRAPTVPSPFLLLASPTTLAIEAAKRLGLTVIGYVRRNSFNLYTHPERLLYHGTSARLVAEPVAAVELSGQED